MTHEPRNLSNASTCKTRKQQSATRPDLVLHPRPRNHVSKPTNSASSQVMQNKPVKGQMGSFFIKLPKEIRLMIWEMAMPVERLVFISQKPMTMTVGDLEERHNGEGNDGQDWERSTQNQQGHVMGIVCQTPIPNIFLVCRESYNFGAKFFKRTYASLNSSPGTYFNFEMDTLCLEWRTLRTDGDVLVFNPFTFDTGLGFRPEDAEEFQKVERLAVKLPYNGRGNFLPFDTEDVATLLRLFFRGVKQLHIILQPDDPEYIFKDKRLDLTLMDAVEVDEAMSIYENYPNCPNYCPREMYVSMPHVPWVRGPIIDRAKLKEKNEEEKYWNLPPIVRSILVPHDVKDAYEDMKKQCQAIVEEMEEKIIVEALDNEWDNLQ